jgi:hypothetical protein
VDIVSSETWNRIVRLVSEGNFKFSAHALDEVLADGILLGDIVYGVSEAHMVEDYPEYGKGPCVLVLLRDNNGNPVHALWGIPRGKTAPAVLITAYRPDPGKWTDDFLRRMT